MCFRIGDLVTVSAPEFGVVAGCYVAAFEVWDVQGAGPADFNEVGNFGEFDGKYDFTSQFDKRFWN